ncbi:MAG: sigma-70 family RNA polymerase sigma factor [Bacteroidales bacterium]|nr:sigma-70 family RNA polymerase sigma factor [Bacteroidales bacterium]MDD2571566.1 sigma-70 family RNA polymerase sigma factor [Bacteroidales bacterium]MDD2812368.1 sigma-70 family RNA polymerase sigma factor [Bacteroidales bacterium]MDD3810994.1 sigma-70 family RNA polymerase sigma factor [Bacteroidales bacterium]MDD3872181.1 sigma-70 family RNA polymerase sigma factor [Bacteroidales bacterium]
MSLHNLDDYVLVEQYIAGDQACIEELITRHKNRVYTYILLIVRNPHLAEDIFQDTFIKVIKSLKMGKYHDKGKFLSWVLRIAHNLIIDHYRKQKLLNTVSNDSGEVDLFNNKKLSESTIEETIVFDQTMEDVRRLVDALPEDQRQVVYLRHYCGLSFKEIADQTGVSINTALGRMRYALINMRKMVREKNMSLALS